MVPALRFIGGAWTFFWRQPALRSATFFLVFLPFVAMEYLNLAAEPERPERLAVTVVLYLAATVLATWGIACILTVGRRMLQAKSGRLRTSFKAVRTHAKSLIIAILLTELLRGCITVLWGLPAAGLVFAAMATLNIPEIMQEPFLQGQPYYFLAGICFLLILPLAYLLLTSLSQHVVAYEKISFRQALRRSIQLTKPRWADTLAVTCVLGLFWLPGLGINVFLTYHAHPLVAAYIGPVIWAAFDTVATVVWLLGLTQFYKALGGKAKAQEND